MRLSQNFYLRDFLMSEIANYYGIPNIPENPDLAIETGTQLCTELLEPLQSKFGRLAIRSGYRSAGVTGFGNQRKHGASVKYNAGYHIWDMLDANGHKGAAACVVIPWFADRTAEGADWRAMAWWIHDQLPYSHLEFYPKLCAFNISWSKQPQRRIDSFIAPRGCLTKPGMENHGGNHGEWYSGLGPT
ncbi:hypothetical protein [Roseovarius sp. 2305UL8-3]|uniref:hypothetical protein n=1 Tax=Roseovarius conchicola TaxID=3121636 RepID=UPI003528DD39